MDIAHHHLGDLKVKGMKGSAEVICIDSDDGSQNSTYDSDLIFEYPLEKSVHGSVQIYKNGVECLAPTQFLNDTIIDFWIKYVFMERLSEIDKARTQVFSSLFYNSLRNAEVVRKGWTKRLDPFSKHFIVIPISEDSHWLLAVICFPGFVNEEKINLKKRLKEDIESTEIVCELRSMETDNEVLTKDAFQKLETEFKREKSEDEDVNRTGVCTRRRKRALLGKRKERNPMILLFDSFHSLTINRDKIFEKLRQFLTVEWKKRYEAKPIVFTEKNIPSVLVEIPQQQNYHDCGIFLLQCFETFFNRPIQSFSIPFESLNEWFYEDEVKGKREEIFQTILQVLKDQYPDRVHLLPSNFLAQVEEESAQLLSPDMFGCYNKEEQLILGKRFSNRSDFPKPEFVDFSDTVERESSISPTPPLPTFEFPCNTDPYLADESCSSDSDDYYVPLLTPEGKELIDLDDGNNQEAQNRRSTTKQRLVNYPTTNSEDSLVSKSAEAEMLLFYYPELEEN